MLRRKSGFTLIEVSLFLAMTGALFALVAVGVQNSILQQRYNDSVQNFMEFLRTGYAETMNVQNTGNGRSGEAIYGRLITFGENYGLDGEPISDKSINNIYMYDVMGRIGELSTGNVLEALDSLSATVIVKNGEDYKPAGVIEDYVPKWGAVIEQANKEFKPFSGAVLIVRHPNSGVAYTFVKDDGPIEVNQMISEGKTEIDWVNSGFDIKNVDFCVNPDGGVARGNRQDVRIIAGAKNGSGVELVPEGKGDSEDPEGYKCGM